MVRVEQPEPCCVKLTSIIVLLTLAMPELSLFMSKAFCKVNNCKQPLLISAIRKEGRLHI